MSQSDKNGEAFDYAVRLARALHKKHYSHVTQWGPADDLVGVISQIDNMVAPLSASSSCAEREAFLDRVISDCRTYENAYRAFRDLAVWGETKYQPINEEDRELALARYRLAQRSVLPESEATFPKGADAQVAQATAADIDRIRAETRQAAHTNITVGSPQSASAEMVEHPGSPCPHGRPHELDGRCASCDCGKPTHAECCTFVAAMFRQTHPAAADRVMELVAEVRARSSSTPPDPGTLKIMTTLVERAYGIFTASGVLRVAEQDPHSNDPIVAWASDVRSILYRNKPAAIDSALRAVAPRSATEAHKS